MVENNMFCFCGSADFYSDNGFYYCERCGTQVEDMAETGVADEDFMDVDGRGPIYSQSNRRAAAHSTVKAEPMALLSQSLTQPSQIWQTLTQTDKGGIDDDSKPSVPQDFGGAAPNASSLSPEDYSNEIRVRYAMGIQLMIQYQCQALVEKFGASPLICGLAGAIWMQFLAASRVFDEDWTNSTFEESEVQKQEYSKNLPTYLKFCESVVFAGLTSPLEDNEEEKIIDELWNFYENKMDEEGAACNSGIGQKRLGEDCFSTPSTGNKKFRKEELFSSASLNNETPSMDDLANQSLDGGGSSSCLPKDQTQGLGECTSAGSLKDKTIKQMISDMEENGFCYIPPRVNIKRLDYLHYVRKNDGGSRDYVAHGDYYILLCACAQVVQVDVRKMHDAVLKLEKRLAWIESHVDCGLHIKPPDPSSKSSECKEPAGPTHDLDDSLDFQNENL